MDIQNKVIRVIGLKKFYKKLSNSTWTGMVPVDDTAPRSTRLYRMVSLLGILYLRECNYNLVLPHNGIVRQPGNQKATYKLLKLIN